MVSRSTWVSGACQDVVERSMNGVLDLWIVLTLKQLNCHVSPNVRTPFGVAEARVLAQGPGVEPRGPALTVLSLPLIAKVSNPWS